MWMVDPSLLCKDHLLGEHKEVHMLVGSLAKGTSLGKYLTDKLVDPSRVFERHDALVREFVRRQYQHHTPLNLGVLAKKARLSNKQAKKLLVSNPVDTIRNLRDLQDRCWACAARIEEAKQCL
jgi:hypothetical protein